MLATESLRVARMEDQAQKRIPFSTVVTTTKAKGLFAALKEKAGPNCGAEFTATSGWLEPVKDRCSFRSLAESSES